MKIIDISQEIYQGMPVYPGDPTLDSVQEQPYILIAQRCRVDDIRRRMRQNGRPQEQIDAIRPDREIGEMSGDLAEKEPEDSRKALVLTKLYKQYAADTVIKTPFTAPDGEIDYHKEIV